MAASPDMPAQLRRDGDALVFSGALLRDAVSGLWSQSRSLRDGAQRIDLTGVSRIDSAGLALVAELADGRLPVDGEPVGLAELRGAYRLGATLGFAT
ncbi:lipid asymmetry maintenance protein MlaB [Lysobacter korlensis]|uniref:Lipid asymmetry maintenance protein MlaB n=1 Tax=Lysobacter korlensis TaxID=553636 RepID=A0ABV6RHF1_9GAMM